MVTLASPVMDMRECMAIMPGAQEIQKGERLLVFAASWNLVISNTCFRKWPDLITYTSSEGRIQIDLVLFRKTFYKLVRDVTVILGEEIHHLLFCDFCADIPPPAKKKFIPHLRTRRLKEPEAQTEYQKAFIMETTSSNASGTGTKGTCEKLNSGLP